VSLDPILKLLLGGIVFFTAVIIYTQKYFPNDGQTFQVFSNLLAGFAGAFLGFATKSLGIETQPLPAAKPKTPAVTTESQDPHA
jgi:uncharacterized membrane protein YjjP (DUF1212 family)